MKNIWRIIKLSKPLHGLLFILGTLILFSSTLQLGAPILSKFIVDEIVAKIQGENGSMQRLIFLIVLAFASELITQAITSISNRLGDHFTGRARKFLTEKFYEKVLSLPQSYFDSQISGKIINQLNRGIFTIYQFLNQLSNMMMPMLVSSIFTVAVLAYFNPTIALLTFILFPIYITLSYISTKKWGKYEAEKNMFEDYTRGRMGEAINNIRLVKGFTNEILEFNTVSKNLTRINKIYAKQSTTYHKIDFARNLSLVIIMFAINFLVFYSAFIGTMTIGEMVLILQLFNQARIPLFAMSYFLTQVQQAEVGSKEYLELLNLESVEDFTKKEEGEKIEKPNIEFKNVSFKYEESEIVLENINFTINTNETVALVGHSGAGKTTIINLILKLYQPTSGEIFLKDIPYQKITHQFVRNNIALVFQENELFSSTIKENVVYGKADATDKEIIEALKMANAYEFVKKLPKGLESEIGERGIRLSGGQKQRIQIARAILKDAPILILDEATSSLDAKSEKEVQEALENLMKNKLVIIIAHRFSTIQNVDKIIVVNEGKIANYGTPHELAKEKGIYSDLLHYQIEGNKKLLEKFELH